MKNAAKAGIFGGIMLAVGAAAGYGVARLVDLAAKKKATKKAEPVEELDFCDSECETCECASECVDAQ